MNDDLEAIDGLCAKIIDQRARIEQLEAALGQCAAAFATSPGTVGQCQSEISTEFQRRMDIAGAAFAPEQDK